MTTYAKNITMLQKNAVLWWPATLKELNSNASIIPKLLESQDDFISILQLSKTSPTQIFDLIDVAKFPANLFLKHLVVISDYGGESMQRLGNNFTDIFTELDSSGKTVMNYVWNGKEYRYIFEALPIKGLGNKKLHIDGVGLQKSRPFDALKRDMVMILLFASTSDVAEQAGLDVCMLGSLLGDKKTLKEHIKQQYIVVSRITGGARANSLGQFAQKYLVDYLQKNLGGSYKVTSNGYIALSGYAKKGGMPFDVVIEKNDKKIGVEVSFQVTTNSTIERKAGQAGNRQTLMYKEGFKIAYVIDGAGNFQRSAAISTICAYSDCTVAYSDSEFDTLIGFSREVLG
jgi:hypothetical protein